MAMSCQSSVTEDSWWHWW